MSIYGKLAQIQAKLFVPKDQKNNFGNYSYRSCEDILKAVKPICEEVGCVLFLNNDLQHIGNFNYVQATATLTDLETGESVVATAHAREEENKKGMDGSQISGASSSYARKYALAGLFCIDNEKDSDATNKGDSEPQKAFTSAYDDTEVKTKFMQYVKRHKMSDESIAKICKAYKVKDIKDLTADNCRNYIAALEKNGGSINE